MHLIGAGRLRAVYAEAKDPKRFKGLAGDQFPCLWGHNDRSFHIEDLSTAQENIREKGLNTQDKTFDRPPIQDD